MIYYVSKVFWLIAAPTNTLVLISAIAAFWAVLRSPNCVAWLAVTAACGLFIGTFTPIGPALTVPLEYRFAFSASGSQGPPDGIILLAGGGGIDAVSTFSKDYPKARLLFSGFSATDRAKIFAKSAATRRAFTWSLDHGRLPRTPFTPLRCSNQSPVKGGSWSPQPCICRGLSDAFGMPDFRWNRMWPDLRWNRMWTNIEPPEFVHSDSPGSVPAPMP